MKKCFKVLATEEGISPKEVYESIQELIDAAWANPDQAARQNQIRLFGSQRKPTPEELIETMARELLKNRNIVSNSQ